MKNNGTKEKRKWLVLAYFFNNDGKAASQTITDRIPFFLKENIVPVVLSSPLGSKDTRFPHARIFSLAPSGLYYETCYLLKNKRHFDFAWKSLKVIITIILLPFYLIERLIIHLDSHWSWAASAIFRGILLFFQHSPEVIYSTAGPTSTHLAGLILHKIFKIPWVAEVHDPLVYDFEKGRMNQRYLFNVWLEKKICCHASAVIYFTYHALESADRRHRVAGMKVVLRPGADPPSRPDVFYFKKEKIHFAHFGSLATTRNLSVLIQAFHNLLNEHPEFQHLLSLDIYGSKLDHISQKVLTSFPLGPVLKVYGRLEYDSRLGKTGRQQVIEAMKQSDVLLILHGNGVVCEEYIPSKVYEYLLIGRPILGLTPDTSELGQILLECGHRVVDPNNVQTLQKQLLGYILTWKENGIDSVKVTTPYTIEKTVQKLISLVDSLN
ncbi:MAG: hypothetical protein M8357_05770 [Desulfobulbaceae bacterium]|nr:hypothetical protein [Desulfobulbaceae bacterium]